MLRNASIALFAVAGMLWHEPWGPTVVSAAADNIRDLIAAAQGAPAGSVRSRGRRRRQRLGRGQRRAGDAARPPAATPLARRAAGTTSLPTTCGSCWRVSRPGTPASASSPSGCSARAEATKSAPGCFSGWRRPTRPCGVSRPSGSVWRRPGAPSMRWCRAVGDPSTGPRRTPSGRSAGWATAAPCAGDRGAPGRLAARARGGRRRARPSRFGQRGPCVAATAQGRSGGVGAPDGRVGAGPARGRPRPSTGSRRRFAATRMPRCGR